MKANTETPDTLGVDSPDFIDESTQGTVKAPFPYFGGKARVAPYVWERLGNVRTYVEPFGGSLAVLLARPNSHAWWDGKNEAVGDYTGHVVNFYRAVKANPKGVAEAASYPVTEADLTARHLWLVRYHDELATQLASDPDFYDTRAAGWWVWGISAWVGGEWCSGLGPWHPGDESGPGVFRKMPMITGNHGGKGIHKPVPSDELQTMNMQDFPHVNDLYLESLEQKFLLLSNRLRKVRITCGDWKRLTRSAMEPYRKETTGVFLDPPYDMSLRRGDLYGPTDSGKKKDKKPQGVLQVHEEAREWALERGKNESTRIAYCAYSTPEEDALFLDAGWSPLRWTAAGGYGLQAHNDARENRNLEIVWFSPHCLPLHEDLFRSSTASEGNPGVPFNE